MKATEEQKLRMHNYYLKHKEKIKIRTKKWKLENPEKVLISLRKSYKKFAKYVWERRKKRYLEIMKFKGDRCELCGFSIKKALQFHHIGKKTDNRDFLKKNYDLSKIQLLCANCHCLIHGENGWRKLL